MIKQRFLALLMFLCAFAVPKVGAQDVFLADKVVAVVGNSVVLYSDVVNTKDEISASYRQQGITSPRDPMCEALEILMIRKILYNQAQIDSIEISTEDLAIAVQNSVDQEVARAGGSVAAVERRYHKPIFTIRTELMQRYEEMRYISNMEQTVKNKTVITAGEVEQFFEDMPKDSLPVIPEQYIFSQITMLPKSQEEAELRARERLLELRERIAGGARFETLARMYSEDPGSASKGGEYDWATKDGFVKPFADALGRLKPGQVSEVVQTEYGFHIIQLIEQRGNEYRSRHILIRPQFTDADIKDVADRLDTIRTKIMDGEITFSEAALLFSDDKYSRNNGGRATNLEMLTVTGNMDAKSASTRFLREQLTMNGTQDYNHIRELKPGDISPAFSSQDLRGNICAKIIKLDEIIPAHPADFSEDYERILAMALAQKQDADFEKWLEEKSAGMYIRIDDRFRGCEFDYKFLVK